MTVSLTHPVPGDGIVNSGDYAAQHVLTGTADTLLSFNSSGAAEDLTPAEALTLLGLSGTGGAALIGKSGTGTVQSALSELSGISHGIVASGSVNGHVGERRFIGALGGGTVYYGDVRRVYVEGARNVAEVRNNYTGINLDSTVDVTTAVLSHNYVWKTSTGNVTNLRGYEMHVRHDGTGTISVAKHFNLVSITLGASASLTQVEGYASNEIGHNTKVNRAYDFYAPDGSQCVTKRVSFYSELSSHANKFAFLGAGTAQSAFGGYVAVGKASAPSNPLDVYAANPTTFVGKLDNAHATTPYGLNIVFSGGAPNNTTVDFMRFDDTSGTKLRAYSNGGGFGLGAWVFNGITSSGGGIGYSSGAGGSVTQTTSKTTGVTLNKACGRITTAATSIPATSGLSFTLTNSTIGQYDVVMFSLASGNTNYEVSADIMANGSCRVTVWNRSAAALAEAITINFTVIKGVIA